jgi:glucokinase
MSRQVLAVDIGATKIALAAVNEDFSISHKIEIFVHESENLWNAIKEVALQITKDTGEEILGVGIGSAGPLHLTTGSISPVNIKQWRSFPIVDSFKELLGLSTVVLHGDAMALAHAEHRLGAGRGVSHLLGMVVSTGIGGGLILNGRVFTGESGNASFIGHHTINFDGIECACGRRGCVESYASGPRMVEIAEGRGWKSDTRSFMELAADARSGNSVAMEVIDEGARALAIGITNALTTLDIRTVVLGGGVAQAGEVYWKPLREHVVNEARFTDFLADIQVKPAELERDSGLIGAALGVFDEWSN